jgi:type IV pilus biogenesis protein CpaD/CtpE
MKKTKLTFLVSILFLAITNCTERQKKETETRPTYSRTQQYLFDLAENYKADYSAAKGRSSKDMVRSTCLQQLRYFLVDSLGRYIDSINVTVDPIIQKGWLVKTEFHSRDITFR